MEGINGKGESIGDSVAKKVDHNEELEGKSPSYYIKRRFLKNYTALFGVAVICLTILVAVLGYLIMPDDTPNANDRIAEIKKQEPGFSIHTLCIRKNHELEQVNFFTKMLYGQDGEYRKRPIVDFSIKDSATVDVVVFGGEGHSNLVESYSLTDVVFHVYQGTSFKLDPKNGLKYKVRLNTVEYLDQRNEIKSIPKKELVDRFNSNHVVKQHYVLGTDASGRDVLSKLIFGSRISLAIGVVTVLISLVMGVLMGAMAGFFKGWVDQVIQWVMTVIWSIPRIMMVIAIGLALHTSGVWVAFIAVGLTMWVEVARVVRGKIMEIRENLYIEAARALGIGNGRIIIRHMLPNLFGPLIVILTANFADAILIEAGLSFLGLSVQPPMPSWGQMVQEGYSLITSPGCWHLVLFPSLCISLLVLAFNLLGNGLRDAFDPKG